MYTIRDQAEERVESEIISLEEVIGRVRANLLLIIGIVTASFFGGVTYSLSLSNEYQARVTMVYTSGRDDSLTSLGARFGSIAGLAGIDLQTTQGGDSAIALAKLRSFYFFRERLMEKILPELSALEEWNEATGEYTYDITRFDPQKETWLMKADGASHKPSPQQAFRSFMDAVSITQDKVSGFVTMSVITPTPGLSMAWANLIAEEINALLKEESLKKSRESISFLNEQIKRTQLVGIEEIFARLIEEQTKNMMLASSSGEFSFEVIEPAIAPDKKHSPQRAIIVAICTTIGVLAGLLIALFRSSRDDERSSSGRRENRQ